MVAKEVRIFFDMWKPYLLLWMYKDLNLYTKMMRNTFSYVCSLVRVLFFEDMMAMDHTFTFVDGRVLSFKIL
jgi:hypothetical protein